MLTSKSRLSPKILSGALHLLPTTISLRDTKFGGLNSRCSPKPSGSSALSWVIRIMEMSFLLTSAVPCVWSPQSGADKKESYPLPPWNQKLTFKAASASQTQSCSTPAWSANHQSEFLKRKKGSSSSCWGHRSRHSVPRLGRVEWVPVRCYGRR